MHWFLQPESPEILYGSLEITPKPFIPYSGPLSSLATYHWNMGQSKMYKSKEIQKSIQKLSFIMFVCLFIFIEVFGVKH